MEEIGPDVRGCAGSAVVSSGRRRRTLAVRGDYLKITKEELRKELRLRGLRTSSKRIEMIRKLERWEQERREQERREQDNNFVNQRVKIASSPTLPVSLSAATGIVSGAGISGGIATGGDGGIPLEFVGGEESLLLSQMRSLQQGDGRKVARRQQNKVGGDSGNNGDGDGISAVSKSATQRSPVELHTERQNLVIWRRPWNTLRFFVLEVFTLLGDLIAKLCEHKVRVCAALLSAVCMAALYYVEGSHQRFLKPFEKTIIWCAYWLGLGILSSVGLGTGLHTFILYLGPHIAAVTFAAHKCKTVNFLEPPYPEEINCPTTDPYVLEGLQMPSIWAIMSKVRLEAFMWGAGTALGELPPYFMARAARLSGALDEEDLEVLEEIRALETADRTQLSWIDRIKLFVENLIQKVGFWGILACASIPNPLFDVAGIMCGHFLVPFRTFFGATLLGKAVFKMHFQKLFVIFVCGESHVQMLLNLVRAIPAVGPSVVPVFEEYLQKQTSKLRPKEGTQRPVKSGGSVTSERTGSTGDSEGSLLSTIFERFVLVMVFYFVISIVNSMAQNYHKRTFRAARVNKKRLLSESGRDKVL